MKTMRIKAFFCAAALVFSGTAACLPAMPAAAAAVSETTGVYNGMKYEIMSNYCLITGYTDDLPAELVIPEQINGHNVEWIHMQAFEDCTTLKSVTLPSTLKILNGFCFYHCSSLETVIFPEKMEKLETVYSTAFEGTPWLENQKKTNPLIIIGPILLDGTAAAGDVVIPEGIRAISDTAFLKNEALTSVKFPSTLREIDSSAFSGCKVLKSFTFPGTVEKIESGTFRDCSALETVTIESGVTEIGSDAFEYCKSLKTINFPDTLHYLNDDAFGYCESLETVELPESVRMISWRAFINCTNLKSVTVPNYYMEYPTDSVVFTNKGGGWMDDYGSEVVYTGVLRGYNGSTTQAYAEKMNITFDSLGDPPTSGKCGENLTWELKDDTLTIDGSGVMNSYNPIMKMNGEDDFQGVAPWITYRSRIKHAVIGKDVEAIAIGALSQITALETVTILNAALELPMYGSLPGSFFPRCINRGYDENGERDYNVLLRGYPDSTTQEFAEGWGYKFEALEGEPDQKPAVKEVKTGTCGENLTWKVDPATKILEITGTGDMYNYDGNENTAPWLESIVRGDVRELHLGEGVTGIGDSAFLLSTFEKLIIPENITRIGTGAFCLCGDLKTISILNPECKIEGGTETICGGLQTLKATYDGIICGYADSTAQKYAKENGYQFAPLQKGDADAGGSVSIEDAQLTLQAYAASLAGTETGFTAAQIKLADINGDETVTVEDAQLILLYYTENYVANKTVTWEDLLSETKKA